MYTWYICLNTKYMTGLFPCLVIWRGLFPCPVIWHMSIVISLSHASTVAIYFLSTLNLSGLFSIWSSQVRISGCQDSKGMFHIPTYT